MKETSVAWEQSADILREAYVNCSAICESGGEKKRKWERRWVCVELGETGGGRRRMEVEGGEVEGGRRRKERQIEGEGV